MIAVLTDPAKGGTFLTWTLHFLAGHSLYYHSQSQQVRQLPINPLTDLNAHNFQPNQPVDLESFNQIFSDLVSRHCNQDTMYFHNFWPDLDSTRTAVEQVFQKVNQRIVLTTSAQQPLYDCKYQGRVLSYKLSSNIVRNQDWDDQFNDFVDTFYPHDDKNWQSLGLTNIWDKREFLALNLRPFKEISILNALDTSEPYYHLDSRDLWTSFDYAVPDIFDYLGWSIDLHRFDEWQKIYHQWRSKHYDRVRFGWYFEQILEAIIQGHDMDLARFNLDLVREAAIQHALIYRHNLNLKTWGLDRFLNTRQLHNLLEGNIHNHA